MMADMNMTFEILGEDLLSGPAQEAGRVLDRLDTAASTAAQSLTRGMTRRQRVRLLRQGRVLMLGRETPFSAHEAERGMTDLVAAGVAAIRWDLVWSNAVRSDRKHQKAESKRRADERWNQKRRHR